MSKHFIYDFKGKVHIQAKNKKQAEQMITGIDLGFFLTDESVYQVDTDFTPIALKKRLEVLGTTIRPAGNEEQYRDFKDRKYRYNLYFQQFLDGEITKSDLIKKLQETDDSIPFNNNDHLYDEVHVFDLEGKKERKICHLYDV